MFIHASSPSSAAFFHSWALSSFCRSIFSVSLFKARMAPLDKPLSWRGARGDGPWPGAREERRGTTTEWLAGWWFFALPLWKIWVKVSWDDYSQDMGKWKMFHQQLGQWRWIKGIVFLSIPFNSIQFHFPISSDLWVYEYMISKSLSSPISDNVGIAIINHPPFITINGWYKPSKIRVVYDIAIPLLKMTMNMSWLEWFGIPPPFQETFSCSWLHLQTPFQERGVLQWGFGVCPGR